MNISLCLSGASEIFLVLRWVGWKVPYTFHINLRLCNSCPEAEKEESGVSATVGGGRMDE